jgi:hypothetical protein
LFFDEVAAHIDRKRVHFAGSDTTPVREILNSENGVLTPFFDTEQLAARVIEALTHPRRFRSVRAQALTNSPTFDRRVFA